MQREFSVLAEGRHIFGRRPNLRAAKPREKRAGHYKDLTETGNRARKVSGTQGKYLHFKRKKNYYNLHFNLGLLRKPRKHNFRVHIY